MRKAPPEPDDRDDAELFRAAIGADRGEVRALPAAPMPPSGPKPKPSAKMARRDEDEARAAFRQTAVHALEAGDALSHRRDEMAERHLFALLAVKQMQHGLDQRRFLRAVRGGGGAGRHTPSPSRPSAARLRRAAATRFSVSTVTENAMAA